MQLNVHAYLSMTFAAIGFPANSHQKPLARSAAEVVTKFLDRLGVPVKTIENLRGLPETGNEI